MNTKHPLKIGFVLDDSLDASNGVQQYVLTLGAWLESQGHEVQYLCGESSRYDLAVHSLSRNITVRFNGNQLTMPARSARKAIIRVLNEEKFDVLHVQMPFSPLLAGKIITLANKYSPKTAIIGTFHILPRSRFAKLASSGLALWTKKPLACFDKIFAVSEPTKTFAKDVFGVKAEVLPCPVDVAAYRQAAKPTARTSGAPLHVVFLGRLVPRKGCLVLLEALSILKQRTDVPKFRATIAGSGPQEAMLTQFAAEHNLRRQVSFAGFADFSLKTKLFSVADVCVFPSGAGETFGIVLIEAMAVGHAVVLGGDNDGYKAVLGKHAESLFPYNDSQKLAETLVWFLQDQTKRKDAITWQIANVKQYDVSFIAHKLLDVYRDTHKKRAIK
jgi:phosphatidylinositol alpha-mannosyltransferase